MPSRAQLDRIHIVLVNARNPLNIGAAARAMSNFGFSRLRVVNPYPLPFREAKSAVNASHVLGPAEEFPTVPEAVADCSLVIGTTAAHHRQLDHPLKRLETGARIIRKQSTTGNVAILFGSEKTGLSQQDLSHCHWLLRIPTREAHASMNLGQAVAICLYELVRLNQLDSAGSAKASSTKKTKPKSSGKEELKPKAARAEDLERLTKLFDNALSLSKGDTAKMPRKTLDTKLRRLVHRLNLSVEDATNLLGILRQIVWKLEQNS